MDNEHWLSRVLAEVEKKRTDIDLRQSLYGAADIAAKYCGFSAPPTPMPGQWQHGWKAPHRQLTAQYEMGELEPLSPDEYYWVARKDQEVCLHQAGLLKARAIGLPCVYLPDANVERHENSLLVMPAHSLDYTRHDWKFEEYADQIESIRKDFDEVIACVHKSCFDRGLWVESFRQRNIPVVVGAHTSDPLTLYRQQAMLSSFGFVTTNGHGSHLAYGAFWGARVSIYGTYADFREEDFSNTPFYQRFPELIGPAVDATNERAMREHYPRLFSDHPKQTADLADWGSVELGADNRLSPGDLRQAFHWGWNERMSKRVSRVVKKIGQAILPRSVRKRLEKSESTDEELRLEKEICEIQSSPSNERSTHSLLGHDILLDDGEQCAFDSRIVFQHQVFQFHTANPNPRILDIGAGIGLATIYLSRLHPNSSIVSFESNPEAYELLQKNCESFSLSNIEFVCPTDYQKLNLKDYLSEQVDFLGVNFPGDETSLLASSRELLANVERICIRYYSNFNQVEKLSALIGILEESGFRIHLHNLLPAPQPLVHRPVISGYDQQLLIFAVKQIQAG